VFGRRIPQTEPLHEHPVVRRLSAGAGSNTAADHVAVLDVAMAQIPELLRRSDGHGRVPVLVRTDAAGATHQFAAHLAGLGVEFSVGARLGYFGIHAAFALPSWSAVSGAQAPRRAARVCRSSPARARWSPRSPLRSTCRPGRRAPG
jgi:hypothetical protein